MNSITLLWTGGWDSTFRLLQLVEDADVPIQPLYLVDEHRSSTPREIDTMRTIRSMVEDRCPKAREQILPTDYGSYRATTMESHYREMWEALKERGRVGMQYPILASHAEQNGIERMELSIEATTGTASILESKVEPRETRVGEVYVLPREISAPESMFARFAFPLLGYTKLDMKKEAERRGWMPVLQKTWFCFNPTFGLPCGKCQPCKIARKEGMAHRVGWAGPLLASVFRANPRVAIGRALGRLGVKQQVKQLLDRVDLR